MARIAGVDLPRNKRIIIGLTYIFGIGDTISKQILDEAGIDYSLKTDDLTDKDITSIRAIIDSKFTVEGDLRKERSMNVKMLMDLGNYRGIRHRKGLPVRGQRTSTNARTRKGPKRIKIKKK